jgi:hypothetical protein
MYVLTSKFGTNKGGQLFTAQELTTTTTTAHTNTTSTAYKQNRVSIRRGNIDTWFRSPFVFLVHVVWGNRSSLEVLLRQDTHLLQGRLQVIGRVTLDTNDVGAVECDDILQGVSPDGVDPV